MTVSVLIPAYRPTYLRQAIASVLTQGFEDFELVIGDDNPGDEVEAIVGEFRDRRIRLVKTAGAVGAIENCRLLWNAASRPLLKYLFDDDLLMPSALVELVGAMQAHPDASFCFSNRYIIDEAGRITSEPKSTPDGRVGLVPHAVLLRTLLPNISNPIGEFSNVLINRNSGAVFDDWEQFGGFPIRTMADVVFFLNATARAPAVQLGMTLAAFRRHPDQNSSPAFNPRFSRGLVEWEIMLRSEFDAGGLTREQALGGAKKLAAGYASWTPQLPELEHVRPGLDAWRAQLADGNARGVTDPFRAALAAMDKVVERRWREDRARRGASAPPP